MVNMREINHFLLFLIYIIFFNANGQIFEDIFLKNRALQLYFQGNYSSVNQAFIFFKNHNTTEFDQMDIDYTQMASALRLNDPGAENLINDFKSNYPNNRLTKNIYFELANHYFNNEKYSYAEKWFSRVNETDIPRSSLPKFYFNKGYTFFTKKKYSEANLLLEKVKFNPRYESDAHYYLGHIAYQSEDYESASSSFKRVSNSDQQSDLGYFQVEMNFKLGRFENAIELGIKELKNAIGNDFSQISKIIGESYFNIGNYKKALPFLLNYNKESGKWTNVDYYQLGYAYYETKDYNKAIELFSKIIGKKDRLAQNAYYYLAECYLKENRKTSALNAYRSSSSMNFSAEISEISLLNYARLSYEIGNPYESTPDVLVRFMDKYPKSQFNKELSSLLLNSYSSSGDFDSVIRILNSKNKYKDDKLLQKVNFLKAIKLFNSGMYQDAKEFFQNSININKIINITARSHFWKGQANYELRNFKEAFDDYNEFEKKAPSRKFINELNYHYHLGYNHLKMRNYELSILAFKKFTDSKIDHSNVFVY